MQNVLTPGPRTRRGLSWSAATLLALSLTGVLAGQNTPPNGMVFQPAPPRDAHFQPYIFWAYGLACALLFLFMLWTLAESRRTRARLDYLEERLRRAYPDAGGTRTP